MDVPPLGPGTFLRAVRAFRGLSRIELGRRAEIHPQRIALLEGGIATPTLDELHRLWGCLSSEIALPENGVGQP